MRKFVFIVLAILVFFPVTTMAAEGYFEAKVLEVIDEREVVRESGDTATQQNVRVEVVSGIKKGQSIVVEGVNDIDVVGGVEVKKGNKVVVSETTDYEGKTVYTITDHVRRGYIYLLALVFAIGIILVGKKRGAMSLLSLVITFLIIMYGIIPLIIRGWSPVLVSIVGATVILAAVIYLTWGWKRKAHIAMASIFISLIFTGLVSVLFTFLTKLSGLADDNILYLVGIPGANINFEGLLLAGIIIGTLGVLDDVVIAQISSIEQIKKANKHLTHPELFRRGIKVGVDHISSMVNTLFLAYAGVALPLLLLFSLQTDTASTFSQVINNEIIATEIVRTLTGSLGLIFAVPLSTYIAAHYLIQRKKK